VVALWQRDPPMPSLLGGRPCADQSR
jgi:hypothetical protein